jgi:addiction module HigA family antidote
MMHQPRRTIAVNPGEILQEILDQNQITQSQVAQRLTMAQSKINEICRGKRGVTPDMAMRLGKLFGQTLSFGSICRKTGNLANWTNRSMPASNHSRWLYDRE